MKKVLKLTAWFAGILVATLGLIFLISWKSPKYYTLQSSHQPYAYTPFKNYSLDHPRPFIVQTNSAVIFGAQHTKDPNHKEIPMIEAKWEELKPTVALVEGRLGF